MGLVGGGSRSVVRARLSSQRSAAVALLTRQRRPSGVQDNVLNGRGRLRLRTSGKAILSDAATREVCPRSLSIYFSCTHCVLRTLHRARPVRP